ncbi:MAG TPA: 16S rRNA (guanine(527)-N(7))-methyltransferase RsmG [Clostridiales bacterium]|jgi:16S rRNA (guanine527-N7)-methyltransferase|nr:16S rRNA (guanine(527)-N(7))-methyltransferase RsmG [Clostridiales bacterium]
MDKLKDMLKRIGIEPDEQKQRQFSGYRNAIIEWNKKVNLTAITNPDEFENKHFVESLIIADKQEFKEAEKIIDVGTGAGFPGVPLAICFPDKKFVLVDSLAKRLRIIEQIAGELQIGNVECRHGRAEDLGRQAGLRESFDLGVSRAVARLATLAELVLPLVMLGGSFAAFKANNSEEELIEAKAAIHKLGGTPLNTQRMLLPGDIESLPVYWFRKNRPTPKEFPRRAGIPSKKPIIK